jgi:hypothetical protein
MKIKAAPCTRKTAAWRARKRDPGKGPPTRLRRLAPLFGSADRTAVRLRCLTPRDRRRAVGVEETVSRGAHRPTTRKHGARGGSRPCLFPAPALSPDQPEPIGVCEALGDMQPSGAHVGGPRTPRGLTASIRASTPPDAACPGGRVRWTSHAAAQRPLPTRRHRFTRPAKRPLSAGLFHSQHLSRRALRRLSRPAAVSSTSCFSPALIMFLLPSLSRRPHPPVLSPRAGRPRCVRVLASAVCPSDRLRPHLHCPALSSATARSPGRHPAIAHSLIDDNRNRGAVNRYVDNSERCLSALPVVAGECQIRPRLCDNRNNERPLTGDTVNILCCRWPTTFTFTLDRTYTCRRPLLSPSRGHPALIHHAARLARVTSSADAFRPGSNLPVYPKIGPRHRTLAVLERARGRSAIWRQTTCRSLRPLPPCLTSSHVDHVLALLPSDRGLVECWWPKCRGQCHCGGYAVCQRACRRQHGCR